jgi:adenylate cyclase
MIRSWSARRPSIVLVDDVHWIDRPSELFLREIVAAVPGTRTLLLLNFRPEYQPPPIDAEHGCELVLPPLAAGAARELIDDLLGSDPSLARLPERIRERAAGNPFFIEEVVRSLVESRILEGARGQYRLACPAAEVAIPVTIHAVLAARIDRLGEQAKAVLHAAAVIGRTFARSVLARVTGLPEGALDACLGTLGGATLIRRARGVRARVHVPPSLDAGGRVPLPARLAAHALHAAAAQALEELYPRSSTSARRSSPTTGNPRRSRGRPPPGTRAATGRA